MKLILACLLTASAVVAQAPLNNNGAFQPQLRGAAERTYTDVQGAIASDERFSGLERRILETQRKVSTKEEPEEEEVVELEEDVSKGGEEQIDADYEEEVSAPEKEQGTLDGQVNVGLADQDMAYQQSDAVTQEEVGMESLPLAVTVKEEEQPFNEVVPEEQSTDIQIDEEKSEQEEEIQVDQDDTIKSKRQFVKYESSKWESLWLDRVDEWASNQEICQVLLNEQADLVHDYLNATCTSRYTSSQDDDDQKWCMIDDEFRPLWYNTANRETFELSWVPPLTMNGEVSPPQPVVPTENDAHIFSKFTFKDEESGEEYVEFIEPLVSHLRFPLAHCIDPTPNTPEYKYHFVTFRGWIIPPPPQAVASFERALYYDAGASSWELGSGGPSLKYFFNMWNRSDFHFDEIIAFEMTTSEIDFYKEVPLYLRQNVHYRQCAVSSVPEVDDYDHPFVPNMIKRRSNKNDYVLFKLDIDSPKVENNNIEYILQDPDTHIDELVWEHHVAGNYLMTEWGDPTELDQLSLRESYDYFLKLREKGIRAHSWV